MSITTMGHGSQSTTTAGWGAPATIIKNTMFVEGINLTDCVEGKSLNKDCEE